MSSHDPRVVSIALEDLLQELGVWSLRASHVLAEAAYAQSQYREITERTWRKACIVMDHAKQDEDLVANLLTDTATMINQSTTGKDNAELTLHAADEAVQAATATLKFWGEQLQIALAWLERAEARLVRALAEYESAKTAYQQAQWELDRTQSRYNACINNRERRNCDGEARAVRAAQAALHQAAYRLQVAEAEVTAAREEVAAARARVHCCSNAVDAAKKAVSLATEAYSEAQHAVNSVERSLEFADAANQHAFFTSDMVAQEMTAAEAMQAAAREAVSLTDEAAARLTYADRAEESAQRYARGGMYEIRQRLAALYLLNRPDLSDSSVRAGITRD
jgi:exonuclease VII small subunit